MLDFIDALFGKVLGLLYDRSFGWLFTPQYTIEQQL